MIHPFQTPGPRTRTDIAEKCRTVQDKINKQRARKMERWEQNRAEKGKEGNGRERDGTCACGQTVEVYREADLVR